MANAVVGAGGVPSPSTFRQAPATRLGRVALWLELGFVGLFSVNMVSYWIQMATRQPGPQTVPPYVWVLIPLSLAGFACGIAGGVVAVVAIVTRRERSWMLWAALVPGLFALTFLLGEFLLPH